VGLLDQAVVIMTYDGGVAMKPRGPLMIEHRLIEKMFELVRKEIKKIEELKQVDPIFIDITVDFIRMYADRTHHGKEEDILFRDLEKKNIAELDKKIMQELIDEHKYGRKTVKELVEAKEKYLQGQTGALEGILDKLDALVNFYPEHIEKEDKVFFPATEEYFSQEEQDAMLEEFWEFDKEMIHEKYRSLVKQLQDEKSR
jgi:hemerythrin-like domain-containing protein